MKIIVIGDIHGLDNWKKIIKDSEEADKIIFLGDYLDPYNKRLTYNDIMDNFDEILQLKIDFPNKIILLLGNHDMHYLYDIEQCSRFDRKHSKKIRKVFKDNEEYFDIVYKYKKHIFTHAGISEQWINNNIEILEELGLKEDYNNIDDVLNLLVYEDIDVLGYIGAFRGLGYLSKTDIGGPMWCDIRESRDSFIDGYHQYVGHSRVKQIYKIMGDNSSITYCDSLENDNYLILNII